MASASAQPFSESAPPPGGALWILPAFAGGGMVAVGVAGLVNTMTALGVALEALFLIFFLRHLSFSIAALRTAPRDLDLDATAVGAHAPTVSVLVACKNEEAVVEALATSLLALDYPPDRLQLVVVDDGSDDRTGEILDRLCLVEPRLVCLHRRPGEGGGKSAALNAALAVAHGEIIIVFDADHQPHTDTVARLVRHFSDPVVAAVQGRCRIRNPHASLLSHLVAPDYLSGYLVNEYGRQALFRLPAYGGANCAVRATALRELGGWNASSVTEDTDLTLRLVLSGNAVRYDVSAVDDEEGVVSLDRYWRQRYRWARGHQQAWRDYRGAVIKSPLLSAWEKAETLMFLLVFHLPMLSGLGMLVLVAWITGIAPTTDPFQTFVLWTLLFIGPLFELSAGLLIAGGRRREALLIPFFLPLFFVSIVLCTKAWLDGVLGRNYAWVKTQRAGDVMPT